MPYKPSKKTGLKDPDFQRARVYRWEDQIFSSRPILTPHDRELLVIKVCKDLHQPCPTLQTGNAWGAAAWNDRIKFGTSDTVARDAIVLHEVSHYLNQKDDGHGGYFMRLYIELIARYLGLPRRILINDAAEWGVAVAHDFLIGVTRPDKEIPRLEDL